MSLRSAGFVFVSILLFSACRKEEQKPVQIVSTSKAIQLPDEIRDSKSAQPKTKRTSFISSDEGFTSPGVASSTPTNSGKDGITSPTNAVHTPDMGYVDGGLPLMIGTRFETSDPKGEPLLEGKIALSGSREVRVYLRTFGGKILDEGVKVTVFIDGSDDAPVETVWHAQKQAHVAMLPNPVTPPAHFVLRLSGSETPDQVIKITVDKITPM